MYQTSIRNKKKHVSFNKDRDINYVLDTSTEEYAYVVKLLGNCRAKILSNTGIEAVGIIRGSMRKFSKRVLIENGDIVVISKRDYQQDKVDIVHKFNTEQCQNLIKTKQLSPILINYYNKNPDIEKKQKSEDYDNCIHFDDSDNYQSSDELEMRLEDNLETVSDDENVLNISSL